MRPDRLSRMKRKPKICSHCGSRRIANIRYGYPDFSDEERRLVDEGKIVLGGCVVTGDGPKWQCVDCGKPTPDSNSKPIGA